jgi:glycosyltransferase involved in cell wall biosynthesis
LKTATIIVCTRNRAEHLKATLGSIGKLLIPNNLAVNFLLVDNASTDRTPEVIRNCGVQNMPMLCLREPRLGLVHARNLGLANATGDYLLWTDDDVSVPSDWISRMTEPLLAGSADAVSGRIRMARRLERPWMKRTHYFRLADNRFRTSLDLSLVGANMAFVRRVLDTVPQFDSELGPGGLGQRDDTLFSQQVTLAGFRICQVDCEVEHNFETERLRRGAWLRHGEASGRSAALIRFHWEHSPLSLARLKLGFWKTALLVYRALHPFDRLKREGCGRGEIRIVEQIAFYAYFLKIKDAPYKYEKFGLRPLDSSL